jgi:hypothetical protein
MAFSRLLLLTLFFTLTLYATPQDFRSCQLKYEVSSVKFDNTQGFAIDQDYVLFYSAKEPSVKVIKRDPFLGLNLMKRDKPFKHIFKFYNNQPKKLAAVLPNEVVEGHFVSEQIGLNTLALFSNKSKKNALISGTCCGILGLSTGSGVIDKSYIRHFLQSKEVVYSDIGIRVEDKDGVRVTEVNPFFVDSPFLLNDVVLSMDNVKTLSAAQLSRDILFSKPGSEHFFVINRDGKKIKIKATFKKRLSGGLIPDSFFDLFGLELDEHLIVKKNNPKYEIKKDDKLLYVMGKAVKSLSDIRRILSQEKMSTDKEVVLLFKREGFDFFIHFPKEK